MLSRAVMSRTKTKDTVQLRAIARDCTPLQDHNLCKTDFCPAGTTILSLASWF